MFDLVWVATGGNFDMKELKVAELSMDMNVEKL